MGSMRLVQTLIPFVHELADVAAEVILPVFRSPLDVADKNPDGRFDPVTAADRDAEAAMRALIRARHPEHGILGEEFGAERPEAALTWVIDPIDGTRAFICGLPLWGVLIGLRQEGEPRLGMIAQPYVGERFIGTRDDAWLERGGARRPLRARPCPGLGEAVLSTTSPFLFADSDMEGYRAVEHRVRLARYGYDCYAYAMVAMGHIDCVIEADLYPYDIEPIIPVIEGAGGFVTDWSGEPATGGGRVIAAGDRRVLDEALAVLSG